MVQTVLWFSFLWQTKHLVCDFFLQNSYMLGKFKPYPEFVKPLAAHAFVQALGTAVIVLIVMGTPHAYTAFIFASLDFFSHFLIDRIKASPKLLGRWTYTDKQFWWALGFDQYLHQLVGILIMAIMANLL